MFSCEKEIFFLSEHTFVKIENKKKGKTKIIVKTERMKIEVYFYK